MSKHLVLSVSLVLAFAGSSSAASPSDRYATAADLLTQADTAAQAAYALSHNTDGSAKFAVLYIEAALLAVHDAQNANGGAAKQDAQSAASAAYEGYVLATSLISSDDAAAAAFWAVAASNAYQAAVELNKKVVP